ncbi:MAG: hypothetical protein A2284_08615 [Deltaproteobacteria bacterium RIFOXYA12_FULL_61_11]|nr:MAG: hypothetical protein A2284_08615 [Deltaproteobacteria bacterium RIFOXYA12_FULL_61_11]
MVEWLASAHILGALFGSSIPSLESPCALGIAVLACLVALLGLALRRKGPLHALFLFVLAGASALQTGWTDRLSDPHPDLAPDTSVVLAGRCHGRVWVDRNGSRIEVVVHQVEGRPIEPRSLLLSAPELYQPPAPGDLVFARVRLSRSESRCGLTRKPCRRGRLEDPGTLVVVRSEGVVRELFEGWRNNLEHHLEVLDSTGFITALLLGSRHRLADEQLQAFFESGLGHFVVVSGLHLALAWGLAFSLCGGLLRLVPWSFLFVRRSFLCSITAYCLCLAYGGLTSAHPATSRSLLIITLFLVCSLRGRRHRRFDTVLLALTIQHAIIGEELLDVSLVLSYLAYGLVLLALPATRLPAVGFFQRVWRTCREHGRLIVIVQLGLVPISALVFQRICLAGFFNNLLIGPLFTLGIIPAHLVTLVVGTCHPPTLPLLLGWLDGLDRLLVEVLLLLPREVFSVVLSPAQTLCLYLGGAALLVFRPWPRRWRPVVTVLLGCTVAWGLDGRPVDPAEAEVHVLDVGHGDAILVLHRGHGAVLIDAGGSRLGADPGRTRVLPHLAHLGLRRLELVVASHADLDHYGGLRAVLEVVEVGELWLGPSPASELAPLVKTALDRGVTVRRVMAGRRWCSTDDGGVCLTLLAPEAAFARARSDNVGAMAMAWDLVGYTVILTSDLEGRALDRFIDQYAGLLRSAVVQLPHHGSRRAGARPVLSRHQPLLTFTSSRECPEPAPGLPHDLCTGTSGSISLAITPDALSIGAWGSGRGP